MKNIAVQSFLRPALTPVIRCKDYTVFLETMERIDRVLIDSSLEREAIVKALEGWDEAGGKDRERRALRAIKALRVEVVRHLLGGISFRCLSQELGRSELLANFCRVREVDGIRKISKSSLERDSKFFDEAYLRQLHARMTEVVGNAEHCGEAGLEKPIDTRECLIDATCLEANIHWPVDWVLLKDVGATLLKAISLIRQAGMKQRMPQGAKGLAREMNKRCLEMTHARRRREAGKARKGILRRMKLLLKKIEGHALRHRDLLEAMWMQSDYTEKKASRIIERMDGMLEQIPQVMKQAHERIIGGRQVKNEEKILSAYEPEIDVIVRGKADREVEFGNTLYLCESAEGYLMDWKLYGGQAPSELKQLWESLERQKGFALEEKIEAISGDRGYASKAASKRLQAEGIFDALTPRNPQELKERMEEPRFVRLQRRRGSTEGRIGVLKNRWHEGKIRSKGFDNRNLSVAWSVLSHNLWKIAQRLAQEHEKEATQAA